MSIRINPEKVKPREQTQGEIIAEVLAELLQESKSPKKAALLKKLEKVK